MAPKKSLFCIAALLVCVLIVNLQSVEASCGGFQESCNTYVLYTSGEFSAHCKNDGGTYEDTSINLDDFIGNNNGNLVGGSGFSASCTNLEWIAEGATFLINGDCKKDDQSYENTSYTLSNNLANDNGDLAWHYC